jgi:hypothetical protein
MLVLGIAGESALIRSPSSLVMGNAELTFSVNASTGDYRTGSQWLARLDQEALRTLISRELPLERFAEALTPDPVVAKTVLRFSD